MVAYQAGAYSDFFNMKRLEVLVEIGTVRVKVSCPRTQHNGLNLDRLLWSQAR